MKIKILALTLLLFPILLAACSPAGEEAAETNQMEMAEDDEMDHDQHTQEEHEQHMEDDDHMENMDEDEHAEHMEEMGHDDDDGEPLIDNDGAVIHIVKPTDGETISGGSIRVEIEIENFILAEDGNHWHIYLDGVSQGMVTGRTNSHNLNGIEPGEHIIEAFLANGAHEQLRDGASVTVVVE